MKGGLPVKSKRLGPSSDGSCSRPLWGQEVFGGDGRENQSCPFPCGTFPRPPTTAVFLGLRGCFLRMAVAMATVLLTGCFLSRLSSGRAQTGDLSPLPSHPRVCHPQGELCWRSCSASRRTGLRKKQRSFALGSLPWVSSYLLVTASGSRVIRTPSQIQLHLM